MIAPGPEVSPSRRPSKINVRVLRQDGPGTPPYWERHQVDYEPDMNVISVLQKIAAQATTFDGKKVSPVSTAEFDKAARHLSTDSSKTTLKRSSFSR